MRRLYDQRIFNTCPTKMPSGPQLKYLKKVLRNASSFDCSPEITLEKFKKWTVLNSLIFRMVNSLIFQVFHPGFSSQINNLSKSASVGPKLVQSYGMKCPMRSTDNPIKIRLQVHWIKMLDNKLIYSKFTSYIPVGA